MRTSRDARTSSSAISLHRGVATGHFGMVDGSTHAAEDEASDGDQNGEQNEQTAGNRDVDVNIAVSAANANSAALVEVRVVFVTELANGELARSANAASLGDNCAKSADLDAASSVALTG